MDLLVLNKPRLDFSIYFKEFISSYRDPVYNPYAYGYNNDWDYWDDDYWDDDDYISYLRNTYNVGCMTSNSRFDRSFGVHNHFKSRYKRGKKKRSKSSKSKCIPLYNSSSVSKTIASSDDSLLFGVDDKQVYFYPDINNPDNCESFSNLLRFDEYLSDMGIEISDYEVQKILNRDISHCCSINEDGHCKLVSDHSYSGLYYDVCEEVDSSNSFWN